jgi:hypothetical protein
MEDTNADDDRWALPAVVTPEEWYGFDGPHGSVNLLGLCAGRRQLVVYHSMFEPGDEHLCAAARRPFFQALPEHARLRLLESVPAPGVTHLHYEVAR